MLPKLDGMAVAAFKGRGYPDGTRINREVDESQHRITYHLIEETDD
jgi:hypothetical protein